MKMLAVVTTTYATEYPYVREDVLIDRPWRAPRVYRHATLASLRRIERLPVYTKDEQRWPGHIRFIRYIAVAVRPRQPLYHVTETQLGTDKAVLHRYLSLDQFRARYPALAWRLVGPAPLCTHQALGQTVISINRIFDS